VLLVGIFLLNAARLLREATPTRARRCFVYSNFYLALLFAAMVIDRLVALA